jgi:hypothetical protein
VFHRQAVSSYAVFQGIYFYSFIDSKMHKRCVLPIPCRYQMSRSGVVLSVSDSINPDFLKQYHQFLLIGLSK